MAASSKASASHARLANHSSGAFSQSTPVGYARTMPGTAGVTVGTPRQLCRVPSQRWGTQNTVPRTSKTPFIGTHGRRFTAAKNASSSGTSCAPQPDVQSEDLATLASTSNKNASGLGVVVTSQANFLRVVVRPEGMSSAQQEAREFQLRNAAATARSAGKTQDAEVLEKLIEDRQGPYELLCVVRALLKKIKRKVLVGDDVEITGIDWVDSRAMVHDVVPRKSRLVDPPVANVNRALLVFACERPPLEAKQLTRFLVSMEATGVPFDLVLNKCDLISELEQADWAARLEQWGYAPRFVSVATGEGVDELEQHLARKSLSVEINDSTDDSNDEHAYGASTGEDRSSDDTTSTSTSTSRVTVLAGPSGVGKSSLINRLRAGSALATALAEAGEFDDVECEEDDDDDEEEGDDEEGDGTQKFRKKNQYITDVDISGGGGGARGALNLNLGEGLELQSVKAVSSKLGRGRHTTRHVTLLPLKSGGLLADTPGFGYPSLDGLTINRLTSGECFPEIKYAKEMSVLDNLSTTGACKFSNCTHRDEPGCVVDLVMPWEEERYDMYCDVFDEVEALEKFEKQASYKRETRVRYKDGGKEKGVDEVSNNGGSKNSSKNSKNGRRKSCSDDASDTLENGDNSSKPPSQTSKKNSSNRRMEPKLETKSNRRQSRRAFNMETAVMGEEDEGEDEEEFWRDDDDENSSNLEESDDDWERFTECGAK